MIVHHDLREKHIFGSKTNLQVVKANASDPRDWLTNAPICTILQQHHILHCGIMAARPPFEVVRMNQSGTYFFASLSGKGKILIDGDWQEVDQGQACVQPPFIPNALTALKGEPWRFCWVRYQEKPYIHPIVSVHSPVTGKFDAHPLRHAIEGLHEEVSGNQSPPALHHWTELIHHYVLSFAHAFQDDDRLQRLWEKVEHNLAHPWTLSDLAALACLSKEHLRRLALKSIGRTPMQHVTFLRMRRAAELLTTTDEKIESVAYQVSYTNPFAFSDTFKRWIGRRPSIYRGASKLPHREAGSVPVGI